MKSKYRSNLTDDHLQQCLRAANSTYVPNYNALLENFLNFLNVFFFLIVKHSFTKKNPFLTPYENVYTRF